MKKLFIALGCLIAFCAGGCGAAPEVLKNTTPTAETIDIQAPDIEEKADINDNIVPFYLPHKLADGSIADQCALSKNGDRAAVTAGGEVLAEILYTGDTEGFPEAGKVSLIMEASGYTLKMRLNAKTACTIRSAGISKEELIRMAESFYLNSGPPVETPAPEAGTLLEGNITAYGELTPAVKAVMERIAAEPHCPYGIVAYQQTAFEGGTLVLAGGLHDGENHPELYFVDKDNHIKAFTTGSDCWELNFTELNGRRIYYGETYSEVPVKEIVFSYGKAQESAAPNTAGVIAIKNRTEDTAEFIRNTQGYILVTDRLEMPSSLDIKKEDCTVAAYFSEDKMQATPIPPYQDVADTSIRYASLYQYNRMNTAEKEVQFRGTGGITLDYGENMEQLEYAGRYKDTPLTELFKKLSVYALCAHSPLEFPAGGKVKLLPGEGFTKDHKITCYFSRLTKDTWDGYKKDGSIGFIKTFRKPDKKGYIGMPDKPGYYLITACVDGKDEKAGREVYTGVIELK